MIPEELRPIVIPLSYIFTLTGILLAGPLVFSHYPAALHRFSVSNLLSARAVDNRLFGAYAKELGRDVGDGHRVGIVHRDLRLGTIDASTVFAFPTTA